MKCLVKKVLANFDNANLPNFVASTVTITVENDGVLPIVTMSTNIPNATIYYTTNGTNPSSSSTEYSGRFAVESSTVVKAIAISSDSQSNIVERSVSCTSTKISLYSGTMSGSTSTETFSQQLQVGDIVLLKATNWQFDNTNLAKIASVFIDRANYTTIVEYQTSTDKSDALLIAKVTENGSTSAATPNEDTTIAAATIIRVKMANDFTASANVSVSVFRPS